jgi:hypothetical protein
VCVKLHDVTPHALPTQLAAALRHALPRCTTVTASYENGNDASDAADTTAAVPPRLLALEAAVRPGCTLLSVRALLDEDAVEGMRAEGAADGHNDEERVPDAASLARALLSGAAASFFRAHRFSVVTATAVAHVDVGGCVSECAPAAPPPRLPRLRPLALCSLASALVASPPGALFDECADDIAAGGTHPHPFRLLVTLHGQQLMLTPAAAALRRSCAVRVTLPACGVDGVAFLEAVALDADASASGHTASASAAASAAACAPSAPRPVLLTRDARIASEVASLGAALDALPRGALADAAEARAERLVAALGYALRASGGGFGNSSGAVADAEEMCPPRLLAWALEAALAHGWGATTAALLRAVPPRFAGDASSGGASACSSVLHAAARCGRVDMVLLVLAHPSFADGRLGSASEVSLPDGGATPLHIAARLPDPAAAARACAAIASADATSPLAWFAARDATGATPAAAAAAAGWPGAAELTAALAGALGEGRRAAAAACAAAAEEDGWVVPELIWEAALSRLSCAPGAAAATARAMLLSALEAAAPAHARTSGHADDIAEEEEEDDADVNCADDDADDAAADAVQHCTPDGAPGSSHPPAFAPSSSPTGVLRRCVARVRACLWHGGRSDAPSEREFIAFMSRRNRATCQVLALLNCLQYVVIIARCVAILQHTGTDGASDAPSLLPLHPTFGWTPGSGSLRDSHRLLNPSTGAVVRTDELDAASVRLGAALLIPLTLLLRAPANVALAYISFAPSQRARFARSYEAFLCAACCAEVGGSILFELGVYLLSHGLVIAYPLTVACNHAFFSAVVHTNGPVRPRWNWPMWALKMLGGGLIIWHPSVWHHTWANNATVWVVHALYATCVALAPRNDRALRAMWAAEKQRAHAAKKML